MSPFSLSVQIAKTDGIESRRTRDGADIERTMVSSFTHAYCDQFWDVPLSMSSLMGTAMDPIVSETWTGANLSPVALFPPWLTETWIRRGIVHDFASQANQSKDVGRNAMVRRKNKAKVCRDPTTRANPTFKPFLNGRNQPRILAARNWPCNLTQSLLGCMRLA